MSDVQPGVQPVPKRERILILDVLRGFALLGILAVNMVDFSSPAFEPGYVRPDWGWLDQLAEGFVNFAAEGKFYVLFSLLFGLGFSLQMKHAEVNGRPFLPFYLRRLGVLFMIGLAHSVFVWRGDILKLYALLGMALLLFRGTPPRRLLVWASVFWAINFLMLWAGGALNDWVDVGSPDELGAIFREDSYWAIVEQRLADPYQTAWIIFQAPGVMAMFLVGLYLGRQQVFENLAAHRALFRRWLLVGGSVGVAGNLLFVFALRRELWLLAALGQSIGGPALALGYAAVFARLTPLLAALAAAGQMALTNYLLQSLVSTTLFYGYGLGWYEQVNPAPRLLLVLAIFAAQVIFSVYWMRRFRFGPLEWMWRSLTYGKAQPFLR